MLATHRLQREPDDVLSECSPRSEAEAKRGEPAHVGRVVPCSLKQRNPSLMTFSLPLRHETPMAMREAALRASTSCSELHSCLTCVHYGQQGPTFPFPLPSGIIAEVTPEGEATYIKQALKFTCAAGWQQ